ncbi:hypothetical protein N7520_000770 [Penicillium odoratum]|uniref:uncharacterized protein n=1 Tax=Penicillium odoratum TaxID=1167516 RepID=UPI0025473D01|nr:uncharacterized protein N7520_000770 [Penicillium odoratum]KAJ5777524.1 hypothetical protein N7520_000770 [Penicillium odoratum]
MEPSQAADPDLNEKWPDSEIVVEVFDVCTVKQEFLKTSELRIQWQYHLGPRRGNYHQLAATNTSKGDTKVYFFVAEDKIHDFEQLNTTKDSDDVITFIVTKDFRYGEKQEKVQGRLEKKLKNRFLVYQRNDETHDGILQHRFIMEAWRKWGNMLPGFVGGNVSLKENPASIMKMMDGTIDNKLKKFE